MAHQLNSTAIGRFGSWRLLVCLACGVALFTPQALLAQGRFKEPVYRVAKKNRPEAPGQKAHPLDPAIKLAEEALGRFRRDVRDYEAILVKRERINGVLGDTEFAFVRIRNERKANNVTQPFGVYMYFLKPSKVQGREVLYVKGKNGGKMLAHEGPNNVLLGRFGSVWLAPDGRIAMRGQRYPVTEIGIENLIAKLLEKGYRDRKRGECEVEFRKGTKINDRSCTMLQVTHPVPRPYFDFHVAQIFIDDELQVPVRYAAYLWPEKKGGRPVLLEEYTYLKLKLNPGLTDKDFDSKNPKYNF